MSLQVSGHISLGDIQNYFGGARPISMSEYYKGGDNIPDGNPSGMPTSGQISISQFYGAQAVDTDAW